MATGHKAYTKESNEVCYDIIRQKCNSKEMEHEVVICDFSNWMVERFDSFSGKNHVSKILASKGYMVCKKRDADHYAEIHKKGCDASEFDFWLCSSK